MSNECCKSPPSYLCEAILVRLPAKSLLRFMCVSKSWQDLISSSSFASRYLSNNVRNRGPVYIITFRKGYMFSRKSFHQCLESKHPLRSIKQHGIYGSSNGLLCISDRELRRESSRICIWNPCLRKIRTLPLPPIPNRKLVSLTFGFHPEVDDYKVVKVVQSGTWPHRFAVEVFSLSAQSWKMKIDSGINRRWKFWGCQFLNGLVYWLIEKQKDVPTFKVVSFDSATETFEEMLVPNSVCGFQPIIRHKENLIIQVYKESICLLRCSGSEDDNKDVQLWLLQQQSFIFLSTFVIPTAGKFSIPLQFKTNDELLVATGAIQIDEQNFKRELISYHLESQEVKSTEIWLKSQGSYFCYPHTHVESLVLLND